MTNKSSKSTKSDIARLSVKEVTAMTGKHRGTIWRLVLIGAFPQPLRFGPRGGRIAWLEDDVTAWLARQ
jgi:predicted DNA-binding transcriptional regulator AlpA